jgi:hypothetical protein
MPAADFCRTVRVNPSTLSPDSGTCGRPPAIRLTAFDAQPPDLQPAPLMDMDFAVIGQLVRRRMPYIRFLSIGSRLCSTLPSDPASRRRPCASLSLLLHQDVKRTCTSKLSIMRGVPKKRRAHARAPRVPFSVLSYRLPCTTRAPPLPPLPGSFLAARRAARSCISLPTCDWFTPTCMARLITLLEPQ